jgi:hypothetical protein
MKKLLLVFSLFFALPLYALTTQLRGESDVVTLTQMNLGGLNSSDSIPLGPYQSGGVQCVWATATGSPAYKLQVSNDNTNWNDVSSMTATVSGAAGSSFWTVSPFVANYAKILITTTGTGTLDCIGVLER